MLTTVLIRYRYGQPPDWTPANEPGPPAGVDVRAIELGGCAPGGPPGGPPPPPNSAPSTSLAGGASGAGWPAFWSGPGGTMPESPVWSIAAWDSICGLTTNSW